MMSRVKEMLEFTVLSALHELFFFSNEPKESYLKHLIFVIKSFSEMFSDRDLAANPITLKGK